MILRLGLAQVNPSVGDLDGNLLLLRAQIGAARAEGVQLLLFPELALCGYPPEDLLLRADFLADCERTLLQLAQAAQGIVVLVGAPEQDGQALYNTLAVLAEGEIKARYHKTLLPNYGVFDERRYFAAGSAPAMIRVNGQLVGLTVCEDIWQAQGPLQAEALAGCGLVLNSSASPYHRDKQGEREQMVSRQARASGCQVAYCNLVGGQDELVFDGGSFLVDEQGRLTARATQFAEQLLVADVELAAPRSDSERGTVQLLGEFTLEPPAGRARVAAGACTELLPDLAEVYAALVLGSRDYLRKTGFSRALLGLSGGVDSALVALIAVDALGAANVSCAVMPSPHSSTATQADARLLAERLGIEQLEFPIAALMDGFAQTLLPVFAGTLPGVAEENIQARIRGNLLMAVSNKRGELLLTTGNKAEVAVGYATLYGDMAGGFAVLKDVPKTLVYQLLEWREAQAETPLVPWGIVERPPSAELAPEQRDSDSLPPYERLDAIIEGYVERELGLAELVAAGLPADEVEQVLGLVERAEYKRRQGPPGIKITPRAFGRDRRMPIANSYRSAASS